MADTKSTIFDDCIAEDVPDKATHYCQIVNPPNLKTTSAIKKSTEPYGIFIPKDQANAVELQPTEWMEEVSVEFGEDNSVEGFMLNRLRCVIIHRSENIEAEQKTEYGWKYVGPAYVKRQATELKELCDKDNNYRMRTRYLLMMVDDENNPLHEIPLQLGLSSGTGGALGTEVKFLHEEMSKVYKKATGKAGRKLNPKHLSLIVLDVKIGFHKSDTERAPFIVPTARRAPAFEQVGQVKDRQRSGGRIVKLTGTDYTTLFVEPKTDLGKTILELREIYSDFPNPEVRKEEECNDNSSMSSKSENPFEDDWEEEVMNKAIEQETSASHTESNPEMDSKKVPSKPTKSTKPIELSEEEADDPIPF